MSSYCVIGSGISGATIANLLSKKNSVHIYDKARGPGGRSSFKRLNNSKKRIIFKNMNKNSNTHHSNSVAVCFS